jgi:hypothetical protein
MKFDLTRNELRERNRRAGRKRARQQQMDKAFGWTRHTRERTRLSAERPDRSTAHE